jgi:hypothetical protein
MDMWRVYDNITVFDNTISIIAAGVNAVVTILLKLLESTVILLLPHVNINFELGDLKPDGSDSSDSVGDVESHSSSSGEMDSSDICGRGNKSTRSSRRKVQGSKRTAPVESKRRVPLQQLNLSIENLYRRDTLEESLSWYR